MNWDAIGAVGELLGALAVIVTLGYLAAQIRQNTRTVRSATAQAIQSAMNEAHAHLKQASTSARIYRLGLSDLSMLDEDEQVQFSMTMYSIFAQFENIQGAKGNFFQRIKMWGGTPLHARPDNADINRNLVDDSFRLADIRWRTDVFKYVFTVQRYVRTDDLPQIIGVSE